MVVQRSATIVNRHGLHARPCTRLVEIANRFRSQVTIRCGPISANAKSVLSLLGLSAPHQAVLEFEVVGDDEEEAAAALCAEVARGFGELDEGS